MVNKEILFKDIFFYLAAIFVKQNHLCNFGREQYGEHSREIILKWFRCHLKIFLRIILALAAILFGKTEVFVQFR